MLTYLIKDLFYVHKETFECLFNYLGPFGLHSEGWSEVTGHTFSYPLISIIPLNWLTPNDCLEDGVTGLDPVVVTFVSPLLFNFSV